jgi:hypothetical protein
MSFPAAITPSIAGSRVKDVDIMANTFKVWAGLGLAAALVTTTTPVLADATHNQKLLQVAESGEGGESGESGEAQDQNPDATFLAQLGYVLGHMHVGTALYNKGEAEMAKTHMKHPRDEIYAALEPVLKSRKAPGFANELDALASAVEAGASPDDITAKFKALEMQIAKNLPADISAQTIATAVTAMVRTAAEEYAIGVKNGKIENLHEYQDAYGFVETAKAFMAALSPAERAEHKTEVEAIEAELNALAPSWPDITGKAAVTSEANVIFAAAAKIELQALGMQ